MEKPYGYKLQDMTDFAKFIAGGGLRGRPLSESFKAYAKISGKAAGSVRNLYYALAKFSREDAEFTSAYLGGKAIKVDKGETFSEEENAVVSRINEFRSRGVSVRRATMCLAGGDAKKALRYQNKYRNSLKCLAENPTGSDGEKPVAAEKVVGNKDFLLKRLKKEIDLLADRLSADLKKENAALIRQLAALKSENERLQRELYGNSGQTLKYFATEKGAPKGTAIGIIQRHKNY